MCIDPCTADSDKNGFIEKDELVTVRGLHSRTCACASCPSVSLPTEHAPAPHLHAQKFKELSNQSESEAKPSDDVIEKNVDTLYQTAQEKGQIADAEKITKDEFIDMIKNQLKSGSRRNSKDL